jgi:hypothetical protein
VAQLALEPVKAATEAITLDAWSGAAEALGKAYAEVCDWLDQALDREIEREVRQ